MLLVGIKVVRFTEERIWELVFFILKGKDKCELCIYFLLIGRKRFFIFKGYFFVIWLIKILVWVVRKDLNLCWIY